MHFYDLPDEQVKRMNIDYDFVACLEYNPQPFNLLDVDKILAVIEGQPDGAEWHWVIRLKDNRFVYLRGGCDYTGWDYQSDASCVFLGPNKRLKDAIDELHSDRGDKGNFTIYLSTLQAQLNSTKTET